MITQTDHGKKTTRCITEVVRVESRQEYFGLLDFIEVRSE